MQFIEGTSPETQLFNVFGLTPTQLDDVIGAALGKNRDLAFCDVFLQATNADSLSIDGGILNNLSSTIVKGAGVRVVIGDKFGYAYTDDVTMANLLQAAKRASMVLSHGGQATVKVNTGSSGKVIPHDLYRLDSSYQNILLSEKAGLLEAVNREAHAYDPRIKNVNAVLRTVEETVVIATSLHDSFVVDNRPMLRFGVYCFAGNGTEITEGSGGGGGRLDFSFLHENDRWRTYTRKAAQQAINMLGAKPCPAGDMTVVLNSGWSGVLIHEATGHGLEADFNRKKTSAFTDRIGEKVASDACTIVDHGALSKRRGSLNVDDEGTLTGENVLIEKGILKGYLTDATCAELMKRPRSGSGRRQDFRNAPLCRMTTTYLAPGSMEPEEIIRSVKKGVYIENLGGGQVDITNGKFVFEAEGAREIVDGELGDFLKGATIAGSGPEALKRVIAVGNDLKLDEGIAICGKDGQSVPVGVGMPTVAIEQVTVGGELV
jgi:TldD protein